MITYKTDDRIRLSLIMLSLVLTSSGVLAADSLPRSVPEGQLNIDDKVLSFFPEDAPAEPSQNLKAMRVRDLLTMTTGHDISIGGYGLYLRTEAKP